jgi:hypothetical protein
MARAKPTLNIWNSIESQVRGSQNGSRNAPLNEFNTLTLDNLPRQGSANSYFQYSHTFGPGHNPSYFYLLQYDAKQLSRKTGLTVGRQMAVRSTFEGILDGATVTYHFGNGLTMDLTGGLSHYLEIANFDQPGVVTGGSIRWSRDSRTHLLVTTIYRRLQYKASQWGSNSTQLLSLTGSQRLGRTVQLYGDATYDTAAQLFPEATVGVIWQPSPTLNLQFTGARYNANRNQTIPTILGMMVQDALWQLRSGIRFVPASNWSLFLNYDWQAAKTGAQRKYGHVVDVGVDGMVPQLRLLGSLKYRFIDSYGGRANDIYFTLRETFFKKLWLDHFTNYSTYTKVTNANGNALATGMVLTYAPTRGVSVSAGGEFDHNVQFSQDWRLTTALQINWDVMK